MRRARRPTGKPTLKTIAHLTGLAVTTVSRALNNAPELAQHTRERVQRVAAELGYQPDRTALRLRTGRTHVLALVLPEAELAGPGTAALIEGIASALRGTAYHLLLVQQFPDMGGPDPVRQIAVNRSADGVILSRAAHNDARLRLLAEANLPAVALGRPCAPHGFVDFDNEGFARAAVRRLAEKGCTRLALVARGAAEEPGDPFRAGFLAAGAEAGLAAEVHDWGEEFAVAPGAVPGYVCVGERAALIAAGALLRAGLTPGVSGHIVARAFSSVLCGLGIETARPDLGTAGRLLVETLLARIAGEAADGTVLPLAIGA